ncbi:MAG: exodeoxyribonuclease VII small subunit [Bacilli bacterium]|jgi:exodeoxyribonuclease VII small subunit|nr:exodeoxyribonuclease VII small subunit [Bacilli bacterium]
MLKKKDLTKLTYQELDNEADAVLKALSANDVSLDDANALYDYGKAISQEMQQRLAEMSKKVSDTVLK